MLMTATPMTERSSQSESVHPLRRALLVIVLLTLAGLLAELVLLEHYESVLQWIPLTMIVVAGGSGIAAAVRPGPMTIGVFRWIMAFFLIAGVLGIYLHLRGNFEFELEMDPEMQGSELWIEVLHGATPVLAPGAMIQAGLVGLAYAFRHPLLKASAPANAWQADES